MSVTLYNNFQNKLLRSCEVMNATNSDTERYQMKLSSNLCSTLTIFHYKVPNYCGV